ncbi:MAG: XcyI family restriction endonuclease [Nitrospirae bacterium]|nr:XcyI family restriction endonuclease [Nitrospirota bacterium]
MKRKERQTDEVFQEALTKSYTSRAKLFYTFIKGKNIEKLSSQIKQLKTHNFIWKPSEYGISKNAFYIIKKQSIEPSHVFCHPDVLLQQPALKEYYRNLAALSKKGLNQILSGELLRFNKFNKKDNLQRNRIIAEILNKIISVVIENVSKEFSLSLAQEIVLAEIGAEIQGTWVNRVGQGAAKAVENIVQDYASEKKFILKTEKKKIVYKNKKRKQTHIILKNNWRIIFSPEPDIAIKDPKNNPQVAIEIKASKDKAGAQTRLGEAKKAFATAKAENANCLTIYLVSCLTKAVVEQLKTEREIDKHFNLIDILYNDKKKQEFLKELFHYQIRIE